jgi:hypothetical protein
VDTLQYAAARLTLKSGICKHSQADIQNRKAPFSEEIRCTAANQFKI